MFFNPDLLKQKIQALLDIQNNPDYAPAAVLLKRKAKQERDHERKALAAEKELQQREAKGKKEAAKKAKEILTARKIKRAEQERPVALKKDRAVKSESAREKLLPNRALNLDQLVPVRVNQKTVVYVKPGYNLKALKMKYNRAPVIKDDKDTLRPKYQF